MKAYKDQKVTIELSPYISVQGTLLNTLPSGHITVKAGSKTYTGKPIAQSYAGVSA